MGARGSLWIRRNIYPVESLEKHHQPEEGGLPEERIIRGAWLYEYPRRKSNIHEIVQRVVRSQEKRHGYHLCIQDSVTNLSTTLMER